MPTATSAWISCSWTCSWACAEGSALLPDSDDDRTAGGRRAGVVGRAGGQRVGAGAGDVPAACVWRACVLAELGPAAEELDPGHAAVQVGRGRGKCDLRRRGEDRPVRRRRE